MSKMTRCKSSNRFRMSLFSRDVVVVLIVALLALTFGLTRLQLKFSLDSLSQETQRLQDERMELSDSINWLEGRVQEKKHPERILSIAEDRLQMLRNSPFDYERVMVSRDSLDRFSTTRLAELEPIGPTAQPSRGGFAIAMAIAERLGYAEPAFAEGSQQH